VSLEKSSKITPLSQSRLAIGDPIAFFAARTRRANRVQTLAITEAAITEFLFEVSTFPHRGLQRAGTTKPRKQSMTGSMTESIKIKKSLCRRDFVEIARAISRIIHLRVSLGARLKGHPKDERTTRTSSECDRETELGSKWNGK
jgi:hypothetical protein